MIHVAVGILIDANGAVLIAQRPADKYCGGFWEFPGGKVEPQEDVYTALQREFREEIGIQIISAHTWFQFQYDYTDRVVLLDVWLVKKYQGEPVGAEGQAIAWVKPQDFSQYTFPAGNKKIIERLLLQAEPRA